MAAMDALVVTQPGTRTAELDRGLRRAGCRVRHSTPGVLLDGDDSGRVPDVMLVSASVGLQHLALLSRRFLSDRAVPNVLVFPEGDFATLAACARAGFDYVVPPYLPELLRARVTSCQERRDLTETVADMAAEASLHEYERELSIAHDIQAGFLPEHLPTPAGWQVAAEFRPAKQVGGDFYDVFELVGGQRLAFVVADVCDKGVGAALFMALIRTLLRHTAEQAGSWDIVDRDLATVTELPTLPTPAVPVLSIGAGPLLQAVDSTNRYMARNHLKQGYFATMFFGVLDPRSGALVYINGGHNPPVLLRADGDRRMIEPTGPAVGMLTDSMYTLGHARLDHGDTLFVYTDGVIEARDVSGELFGTDRMVEILDRRSTHVTELLSTMDAAVRRHEGATQQSDDVTMLAIRRTDG